MFRAPVHQLRARRPRRVSPSDTGPAARGARLLDSAHLIGWGQACVPYGCSIVRSVPTPGGDVDIVSMRGPRAGVFEVFVVDYRGDIPRCLQLDGLAQSRHIVEDIARYISAAAAAAGGAA